MNENIINENTINLLWSIYILNNNSSNFINFEDFRNLAIQNPINLDNCITIINNYIEQIISES